ncbi:helix-turn-helix transcriptional regulator [Ferviditalea candida]
MLPNARQQALSLINYRLLFGGNQVFRSTMEEHPETRPGSKADSGVYPLVQHLRRSIEQADMDEAEIEVQRVFDELGKMESPASIQRAVQYMMIQIHSVWMENSHGDELAIPLEEALQNVNRAANLSQLREHVTDLLGMAIRHIQQARQKENAKPVEQAKSWIEENLGSEITIKKIADSVYMNPTYFCQYFKIQTGETILDFVTRKRMEKAKELLRDPQLKMYEISARIGYHDTKYFSRLFKQWTGQSPSQYRDQHIKQ